MDGPGVEGACLSKRAGKGFEHGFNFMVVVSPLKDANDDIGLTGIGEGLKEVGQEVSIELSAESPSKAAAIL